MKLTIKDDCSSETLDGITLEDGLRPCVDIRQLSDLEERSFVIPHIQVAVWFKTLVLTSVTIDCEARCITWSTKSSIKNQLHDVDVKKVACSANGTISDVEASRLTSNCLTEYSLLKTRDKHHTDEVGNVFVLTEECLHAFVTDTNRVRFYESMLKILHCFILPSITLGKEDTLYLHAALNVQRALINRQDERVTEAMQNVMELKKDLADFRAQMVENINLVPSLKKEKKFIKSMKVPWRFVHQLWVDLGHDAAKVAREVTAAQSDQAIVAKQIQDVLSSKEESFEQRVRSSFMQKTLKRNDIVNLTELFKINGGLLKPRLQRALKVKEETIGKYEETTAALEVLHTQLKTMKESKTHTKLKILRQKGGRLKEEILNYLEKSDELAAVTDGIMSLLKSKVQLISVREAILSSLHSLSEKDENSYGVEYSKDGYGATDVLVEEVTLYSWWLTLEEQVMAALDKPQTAISQKHFTFLADTLFQCDIICTKINPCHHGNPQDVKTAVTNKETLVIVDEEDSVLGDVSSMSQSIKEHVMEMMKELQPFVTVHQSNNDKLRHCYERVLFNKIGESVNTVYAQAFEKWTTQIKVSFGKMTAGFLEFENSSILPLLMRRHNTELESNGLLPDKLTRSNSELLRRNHISTPEEANLARKKTIYRSVRVKPVDHSQQTERHDAQDEKAPRDSLMDKIFPEKNSAGENRTSKYASVVDPNEVNFRQLVDLSGFHYEGKKSAQNVLSSTSSTYMRIEDCRTLQDHISTTGIVQDEERSLVDTRSVSCSTSSESGESDDDSSQLGQTPSMIHVLYSSVNNSRNLGSDKVKKPLGNFETDERSENGKTKPLSVTSEPTLEQSLMLKDEYYKEFLPVFHLLEELCHCCAPTEKLRKGFEASQLLGIIGARLLGMNNIECDTLNDLLVVVLCNMSVDLVAELFLNVEKMKAFLPPPYEINEYGFMVTTWEGIWTFLCEKLKDFSGSTSTV